MKNYRLVTFIILINLISLSLFSQSGKPNDEVKHNFVKISPLGLINSTFGVGYERLNGNNKGIVLMASATYYEKGDERKEGYGTEFQYRYYLLNKKTTNFYNRMFVAPYISYNYLEIETKNQAISYYNTEYNRTDYYNAYEPGIILGYNLVTKSKISFDFYIGAGMRRCYTNDSDFSTNYYNSYSFNFTDDYDPAHKGIKTRLGVDIGFNF